MAKMARHSREKFKCTTRPYSASPDRMDILYLLIPLSLVFVAVIAYVFLWAVKSGQFEDMEGPAHRILMDDDGIPTPSQNSDNKPDKDVH